MKYVVKKDSSGEEVQLHYSDLGQGQPIVLIHGWPLSLEMWEYQIDYLVNNGYRVVKYDRRGFGKSSKPWSGYDYDTLTEDLNAIIEHLNLQNIVLVGFSMGGGEAVRYFSKFGSARISKLVLLGAVTPFLLKTEDNTNGVDQEVFDGMVEKIKDDRIDFLDTFGKKFFGVNLISHPVSTPLLEYYRMLASHATSRSTVECVRAFSGTDFREDLKAVNVPTLVIHGDADQTVPIKVSGELTAKAIPGCRFIVYEGAPHGFFYTEKDKLNADLVEFIGNSAVSQRLTGAVTTHN